eukprot:TRINITY_DN15239_c0_g3_i1.p1 TRINITY_DN15239_c0_g3~~TRINITY_DN15239_c0_g3_i1.p1  ORF type:complete len:520 (+),score=95.62 TRINITY_DN15239_c0_g3_i1:22-1581(+)
MAPASRRNAAGGSSSSSGAGAHSSKSSFSWKIITLITFSIIGTLCVCQFLLFQTNCTSERDRATYAEDLVIRLNSQREAEKKAFMDQIEELKHKVQPNDAGAMRNFQELSDLSAKYKRQTAEVASLQSQIAALKHHQELPVPAPAPIVNSPPVQQQPLLRGFKPQITEAMLHDYASKGAIAVAVIVCKRPKYLDRAMNSLLRADRDPEKFPIVISQDAYDKPMTQMIDSTYVRAGEAYHWHHDHQPDAVQVAKRFGGSKSALGYVLIAQHFGFVMRRLFDEFNFEAVIFVEEDLEVSRDFFKYFGAMRELLRKDKDLFCVSAWNDNGYENLVKDPKAAYRTDFFPGLGWMMDKNMWGEVRERWAVAYWDEFMRRPDVRHKRHCIRPDISRSFTFGEEGVSAGQFFAGHLSRIKLNTVNVDWQSEDLTYLSSASNFDDYLTKEIQSAELVTLDSIDSFSGRGKVLRLEYDDAQYKVVARKFALMEDEKEGVRRMSYRGVIPFSWQSNRVYLHVRNWPYLR